jgi:signal transduction histidine kinase
MRRRLVLAIAGVATMAVVLLAVPLGLVLSRSYRDEELLRLQRDTVATTRAIDLGGDRRDAIELPLSGDRLAVYDTRRRRVAGVGPSPAPAEVRAALRTGRPSDGERAGQLVVAAPLQTGERVTGALLAQRSDAGAARRARKAWLTLAAVAAAIIAVSVLAAMLLARRLAAPLERLATAARRLGDGDFSARAPRARVPELDAVAAALDVTAQRLDDLIVRERAFSADASHQLRTPLQALRIELEAIELRDDAPEELPAALAQVDRLQTTIETLLALARDAPRSSAATTDLAAAIADLEERWRGPLAARGRPFRTAVHAPAAVARAAPSVVGEIIDVLLSNAGHHGAGPVTVEVRELDGWLAVDVGDEGGGFGEDPERAFVRRGTGGDVSDPGTPSRSGDDGSHGIGLALARSLAQAEGGRLSVLRPGPRPTIRLLLPLVPGPS